MHVAITGSGGVGGYYGGMLARAGEDVTFIARGAHLDAMRANGLMVKTAHVGEFTIPVNATDDPNEIGPVDLVLFCVKTYDTNTAAGLIRPLIGRETVVLPLQNGVESPERIGRVVGEEHVIGGTTYLSSKIESPGIIKEIWDHKAYLGELDGELSPRTERLLKTFERAEVAVEIPPDIHVAMWGKLLCVSAYTAVCCVTRLPGAAIISCRETSALFWGAMEEGLAVARASGIAMPDNFLDQIRGIIAGINPMVRPSMYYDLQAGRSLELEDMIGVVVHLGEKHEVSTPLTFSMYAALKPYVNGAPDIPQGQSYSRRQASTSDRGPVHSNRGRDETAMSARPSTSEATAPVPGSRAVRRVAVAALIGTSIEWYDFFIYGLAAALVFAPQFFPKASPVAGTLAALGTFAVGFLARPIGGAIAGHFGDRIGRRPMLVVTLLLMGGASTLIGLLPTYAQIGVAAPVLLVTLRLLQGLAVGGEWGGAVLMSTEHAPSGRRGWYGSFVQLGVPVGLVTSNLVFLLVSLSTSTEQFASWGWRIPFLLSAALVVVGLYVRLRVDETPEFAAHKARGAALRVPIVQVLRQHWRTVLLGLLIPVGTTGLGYVSLVFLLSYGAGTLGMNRNALLVIVMAASVLEIPAVLLAARWSDRVERSRVILWGGAATLVAAALFLPLVDTRSPILAGLAVLAVRLGLASMYGPVAALLGESFPTTVRYSGVSLAYQLGSIAGGGFSPIVATVLVASPAGSTAVTSYLMAILALSMLGAAGIGRLSRTQDTARPTRPRATRLGCRP